MTRAAADEALGELRITKADVQAVRAATAANAALANPVNVDYSRSVSAMVANTAKRHPDWVAITAGAVSITYGRLAHCVATFARRLHAAELQRGDVVAVYADRCPELPVAFLALEAVGAVYLPLDRSWPLARCSEVLKSSGAVLLLLDESVSDGEEWTSVPRLDLADAVAGVGARAGVGVGWTQSLEPSEVRYVIYTSGTTGSPKGAMVEHRGMVNHLQAKIDDLALEPTDRVAFTAPVGFDISVWQMICPLMVGATLIIIDDHATRFPRILARTIRDEAVTVAEVVPVIAAWVAQEYVRDKSLRPSALRWLLTTGEEIGVKLAGTMLRVLPHVRLLNAYGPTECSDDVTHRVLTGRDAAGERIPIGSAVANCSLYLLVEHADGWRPAEAGETAHLFVGGVCVGRGYLGRPELTRRAFYRDIFDPGSKTGRLYHTGDLVRLENGALTYVCRADRQVKIAGVRMELDEIEAVIGRHDYVAECAASLASGGRIEAWVAPSAAALSVEVSEGLVRRLREHAARWLPTAAVPTMWHELDRLPRTGSGKIDYRALHADASSDS